MDPDGLPMIGSGVDYTQVGAIHQKRTLAFINHFITSTVSFLNNFSRSCEVRLQKCESKIQKLEASLGILEAKLSSIPGLEEVVGSTMKDISESVPLALVPPESPPQVPALTSQHDRASQDHSLPETPLVAGTASDMTPAKDDPVYKRFFKMLQVGVPEPAVKLKMKAEGLDPEILSNPDRLLPSRDGLHAEAQDHESTSSGTD